MPSIETATDELSVDPVLIEEFQRTIFDVAPPYVYSLPDLQAHIDHQGSEVRPDIQLADGIFVDQSWQVAHNGIPSLKPQGFSFILQPGLRIGREVSQHKVFFGKVLAHWTGQDTYSEGQVAVKPMDIREVALGELAMLQYCKSLGIPTFQPAGFLAYSNNSRDHLLTEFNGPVETIDSWWDWHELDIDEQWMAFGYGVEIAALLNSNLLFHRDLQARNIAIHRGGEVFVIDLEHTISMLEVAEIAVKSKDENERGWAVHAIKRQMSHELTNICNSVNESIFSYLPKDSRPTTDMAKFKEHKRHIFKPYREALITRGPKYLAVLLEAYELMMKERKQMARDNSPHP
jgi:hypothetical protein